MKTFQEFLAGIAQQGSVNLLFEQGMYSLMDDLERIVTVLRDAKVSFEVFGGVAVNAHVLSAHRSRSFVTRDIDLLIQRHDLSKVILAAESAGYTARKVIGGFMLIRPGQQAEEAVHLRFVGEKPRSSHSPPNPAINPEESTFKSSDCRSRSLAFEIWFR